MVLRHVAMLGGFLARKGDGDPGVKTIWIRMQCVIDFAASMRFMRDSDDACQSSPTASFRHLAFRRSRKVQRVSAARRLGLNFGLPLGLPTRRKCNKAKK